jgi:hypothetical protein
LLVVVNVSRVVLLYDSYFHISFFTLYSSLFTFLFPLWNLHGQTVYGPMLSNDGS